MKPFFQDSYNELVESPNGAEIWWHSIPLPDGNRINGHHPDKDLQFKMWRAMQIDSDNGLAGKSVLDIGANDGFFSLAAIMAGAQQVTSMDMHWGANLNYASEVWQVNPDIVTADFRSYDFEQRYDVIFFLGVLYHLEDVFSAIKKLRSILQDDGAIYIETQMSKVQSELPVFECASDLYPTVAPQGKEKLQYVGLSNYLFPNDHAMVNLAHTYDMTCESLDGSHNVYSLENPDRRFFKFSKAS